jgi:hypothetical protein
LSELRWIVVILAYPATLFVLLYYAPRAVIMVRAGWVILGKSPDKKRHRRALAVLRIVCKGGGRFAWWRRLRE